MYNQVQGTYPQLAGSFYNAQGMMPHDNGRTAHQVPTFFGGLQNMMSASHAMHNYQNIPLGQNILRTQAQAGQQYANSMNAVVGGIGTGTTLVTAGAGLASMAGVGAGGMLGSALGVLGGGFGIGASVAIGATVHSYKKKMREIEEMRQLTQQGNFGHGLTDPFTGQITRMNAMNLSSSLGGAAKTTGFKTSDFKQIAGTASNMGMLTGTNNIGEITKKITDLAKASREIVMLGEGISMNDAMNLQKLTQDMGIDTGKFRTMGLGRNLVTAARAARISMDQAAQIGGQGAITFQQMGLGAASGMNAAFSMNNAAQALVGTGAINQRLLQQLGGAQGIGQNLLAGQASTMGRLADTLVMGAVKMDPDGNFRVDRELLDQFTRGDVSREDMVKRGKNLGKGLTKFQRSRMLEQLGRQMPQLREQVTDSLSNEEMMQIQGREVMALQERTGMSMRQAANAYFQDAGQAESFLAYAQNFGAVRAESRRQQRMSETEEMYRYAGMAKSDSLLSRFGRGVTEAGAGIIDHVLTVPTELGNYMARQVSAEQDRIARGSARFFSHLDTEAGPRINFRSSDLVRTRSDGSLNAGIEFSTTDLLGGRVTGRARGQEDLLNRIGAEAYMERMGIDGIFDFGGGGLAEKVMEAREGELNAVSKFFRGHYSGLEHSYGNYQTRLESTLRTQAQIMDEANLIGELRGSARNFNFGRKDSRKAFRDTLREITRLGDLRAKGNQVDVMDITPSMIAAKLNLDLGDEDVKAAVGRAFNVAMSGQGEYRKGLSKMLTQIVDIGAREDSFNQKRFEEDVLSLGRGGTSLQAEGLDKALYESGIGGDDLQKILGAMNENFDMFQGNTPYNIAEIFRTAGIKDYSRFNMGGVKKLIDTIRGGTITRVTGDNKRETFTLGDNYISNLDLSTVNKNAVNSRINKLKDHERLKLDRRLGQALGNSAGEALIDDLMMPAEGLAAADNFDAYRETARKNIARRSVRPVTEEELDRELDVYMANLQRQDKEVRTEISKHQGVAYLRDETASAIRLMDENIRKGRSITEGANERQRILIEGVANRRDSERFRNSKREELRRDIEKKREENQRNTRSKEREEEITKEARRLQAEDKKKYEKALFGDDATTLREVLEAVGAGGDEDKRKAYQNLMGKDYFEDLESEYQITKSRLERSGASQEEKTAAREEMIKKIVNQVARAGAENKLKKGEAPKLEDIMGSIAGALDSQNSFLKQIATKTKDGKLELIINASSGTKSATPAPEKNH